MDELFAGNPPALNLEIRSGVLSSEEVRMRASRMPLDAPRRELLVGLALLWHDDWNGAHAVAQRHEGRPDFDLLHAMGHRREGDFGNSDYWFSSAGRHPCFAALEAALKREMAEDDPWKQKLMPKGLWSPSAFVAAIKASKKNAESRVFLRRVQALEFRAFADWLVSA
jgi:hypothetical protein